MRIERNFYFFYFFIFIFIIEFLEFRTSRSIILNGPPPRHSEQRENEICVANVCESQFRPIY